MDMKKKVPKLNLLFLTFFAMLIFSTSLTFAGSSQCRDLFQHELTRNEAFPIDELPGFWKPVESTNGIISVHEFLASNAGTDSILGQIFDRVLKLDGGGARGGTGTVLIGRSSSGFALVLTARHIHKIDYPMANGHITEGDFPEFLNRPEIESSKVEKAQLSINHGLGFAPTAVKVKRVYSPLLNDPLENGYGRISPAEDFVVSIVRSDHLADAGFRKTTALTMAPPNIGKEVFFAGFPASPKFEGKMQLGTGKIVDQGAIESEIPFNENVEFIVEVNGTFEGIGDFPGFSGGPIFSKDGKFLGVLVRGNQGRDKKTYLRVVKADYIFAKFSDAINILPEPERQPFIDLLSFPE
jgi:hypothetical protein